MISSASVGRYKLRELLRLLGCPARADRTVVNLVANLGIHHLHNGANQGTWRIILAPVATSVAHVFDFRFVKMRQLVVFRL